MSLSFPAPTVPQVRGATRRAPLLPFQRALGGGGPGAQGRGALLRGALRCRGASRSEQGEGLPIVKDSKLVYDGFMRLRQDVLAVPGGDEMTWLTLLSSPQAAVILAETEDGRLVLTEEYRPPLNSYCLGLPGGIVDEGEEPGEAAARELLEEAGFVVNPLEVVVGGSYNNVPGIMAQEVVVLLAQGAQKVEEGEEVEGDEILPVRTVLLTPEEVAGRMADTSLPVDANLAGAMFFYFTNRRVTG